MESKTKESELNRRIAAFLEPSPTPDSYNDSHNFPRVHSKGRCWTYPYSVEHWNSCATKTGGRCDCDASHGVRQAKPRDFINDPACTVMLLEKLPEVHFWRNPDKNWTCEPDAPRLDVIVSSMHLGRAVAEAFARASGLMEGV